MAIHVDLTWLDLSCDTNPENGPDLQIAANGCSLTCKAIMIPHLHSENQSWSLKTYQFQYWTGPGCIYLSMISQASATQLSGSQIESQCALTHPLFYFCTLYNFIFLDFVYGYLALTGLLLLTWTSGFHCFEALGNWNRAGGQDFGTCGPGAWEWL